MGASERERTSERTISRFSVSAARSLCSAPLAASALPVDTLINRARSSPVREVLIGDHDLSNRARALDSTFASRSRTARAPALRVALGGQERGLLRTGTPMEQRFTVDHRRHLHRKIPLKPRCELRRDARTFFALSRPEFRGAERLRAQTTFRLCRGQGRAIYGTREEATSAR